MARISPYHLLNSSWTIYRLSPLHHNEFQTLLDNPVALRTYAARLQDHLTNTLVNIQGWAAEDGNTASSSSLGALTSCTWETISMLSYLNSSPPQPQSQFQSQSSGADDADAGDDNNNNDDEPSGILVTLTYENNTVYKAALLAPSSPNTLASSNSSNDNNKRGEQTRTRRTRGSSTKRESTYLPLLLTRLPKSLRETFISFLSSTFDTFSSPLRLSSQFMCTALQTYVNGGSGSALLVEQELIKELQLTLTFSPPIAPSLKTLTVNIPRGSLTSFVTVSPSTSRSGLEPDKNLSIFSGLSAYMQKHLAMELGLDGVDLSLTGQYVRLTRIACAGFVITSEGRLKLVVHHAKRDTPVSSNHDDVFEEEMEMKYQSALCASGALLHAILRRTVVIEE